MSGDKRSERPITVLPFLCYYLASNRMGWQRQTAHRTRTEPCSNCERTTPHDVSVEILTESAQPENAEFSREPYRVSECMVCGTTTSTRMNNA